ncbi:hypothetical protein LIER_24368 [Lithospermum erythrorhizon]|uniref:Uncharacterized protein n=1 Tax=Lithospermum erythrorhizon TaxID=34254 RepID=A0AAV3R6M7_LITER
MRPEPAEDIENKYEDLQAVRDGLFKSKFELSRRYDKDVASLKRSLDESKECSRDLKAQLDSSKLLLADFDKQMEQLSQRPTPEVVLERFKEGENFYNIIIDNTISIMKKFYAEDIYLVFPSIYSLFREFVEKHFGREYVVPLADEDDEEENDGDDEFRDA